MRGNARVTLFDGVAVPPAPTFLRNWKRTTLGAFVSLQRGHDLTETEQKPGVIPVMWSAGQNGFHDTARAKGPGVVIGRSGALFGQVHYSAGDYWPHNTCLYVTDSDCFNGYLLALPPPEITAEFWVFAAGTIRKIKANDEQSRTLATLRDALLPKLLSGEIRVGDAEREIAEVL